MSERASRSAVTKASAEIPSGRSGSLSFMAEITSQLLTCPLCDHPEWFVITDQTVDPPVFVLACRRLDCDYKIEWSQLVFALDARGDIAPPPATGGAGERH